MLGRLKHFSFACIGRNAKGKKKGLPKLQSEGKRNKKNKEGIAPLCKLAVMRLTDGR